MATADGTVTLAVVPSPPAEPPLVGLIASLGASGGPYLDPPDTFDDLTLPPLGAGDDPLSIRQPPQRWEGGFQYLPEQVCSNGGATDPCGPSMSVPANPDVVKAMPMLVWAGFQCSTFGWEAEDPQGRAERALAAVESKQIAAELWKGTQAQASGWPNHYLAHNAWADTLTDGPSSGATVLDCLEQGLADCGNGQRGVIYCTRQLASFWSTLGSSYRSASGLIVTYMGTIIIPDAGFDGSGPDGQPAVDGSQWAYATLMPQVRRGPVQATPDTWGESVLRTVNTVTWRAWRPAAVSFPYCCHLAANVNLPLCLRGGAS